MSLANKLITVGKKAQPPTLINASFSSNGSSVSYPAGVLAGRVALYVDLFYGYSSILGTSPPAGYTSLAANAQVTGVLAQVRISYRVLDGSESGSVVGTPVQATGKWTKALMLYDMHGLTPSVTVAQIKADIGALVTSSVDSSVTTATYLTVAIAETDDTGAGGNTSIGGGLTTHWSFPFIKVASGFRAPATASIASAYSISSAYNSCAMCATITLSR